MQVYSVVKLSTKVISYLHMYVGICACRGGLEHVVLCKCECVRVRALARL